MVFVGTGKHYPVYLLLTKQAQSFYHPEFTTDHEKKLFFAATELIQPTIPLFPVTYCLYKLIFFFFKLSQIAN